MSKKGFTVAEVILCLAIIMIIIAIVIPITHGFIERANILDADLKAKTAYNTINLYLLEQEFNGNGMKNNGKYAYIAIYSGNEPIVFDENFSVKNYAAIKAKNDYITDDLTEKIIINSIWANNIYPHHEKIVKTLDEAFNHLHSCIVIAVISDNRVIQVFYIPINSGDDDDYYEAVKFFKEHCVIKGKTDNITVESENDMGTVFTIKDGVIENGRSTTEIYKGIIVGTYPAIGR